jgi:hypothetical protein
MSEGESVRAAVPLRGTIHPAGVVDELYGRRFELGGSYSFLLPLENRFYHGPSLTLGWYENFPQPKSRRTDFWRIGVHAMPGLGFRSRRGEVAFQMAARVTGEVVTWADGPFDSCSSSDGCTLGWAYGETSFGLFAETSYWAFDDDIWTVTAGILFRAPATLGVLFGWLWN